MLWLYLILLLGLLTVLHFWLNGDKEFNKIPGPKGVLIFGNAFDFLLDPVPLFTYLRHLANKYKDLFRLRICGMKVVYMHNPEDVEVRYTPIHRLGSTINIGFDLRSRSISRTD